MEETFAIFLKYAWAPIIGLMWWEIRNLRSKLAVLHEEQHDDKEEYLKELRRIDAKIVKATDYGSLCKNFERR